MLEPQSPVNRQVEVLGRDAKMHPRQSKEESGRKMKHTMWGVICGFKIYREVVVGELVPMDDVQHKYEEWHAEDDILRPGNDGGVHCGEGRTTRGTKKWRRRGGPPKFPTSKVKNMEKEGDVAM